MMRSVNTAARAPEQPRERLKAPSLPTAWGKIMKRLLLAGVALSAMGLLNRADAADAALPAKAPAGCKVVVDPYKNYSCPVPGLGSDFSPRLVTSPRLEGGQAGPPADPTAPPGRR